MRNLSFTGNFYGDRITIEQVQKRTAKKLFDAGEDIYIQSSNFHPFGVWSQCIEINNKWSQCIEVNNKEDKLFDSIVNSFEFYNCNSEAGYYTTFYKRIK